jgi:replicative superfamily II helicase
VALSAVIGDTRGFERWLGGSLLFTAERPVPLKESVLDASGSIRTREPNGQESHTPGFIQPQYVSGSQSNKPWVIPLLQRLVQEGKKVIVFRALRGETVGTALYLSQALGLPPATDTLAQLPVGDRSTASNDLRRCLQGGVAFHNSDLDRDERGALEVTFRDQVSPLRVVVATTTLAMGVNTPAEAVVIAGLKHPGQTATPYRIAEYKNMAGRAGRLGHVEAGEAYIVATSDPGPGHAWQHYVMGQPEPIESHFLSGSTDPQTLLVRSLVALGSTVVESDLVGLLDNSFAIWQRREARQPGWDVGVMQRDLDRLVLGGLIDREPNGNLTLTALGRYAGESGIEVRSITNIGSALRFAPAELSAPDVVTLAQVTAEMEGLYIPANRRSHKEQQRWPMALQQLGVSANLVSPFDATKRAVACLMTMSRRPMVEIEQVLMQHTKGNSAAGNIRQVTSRTRDVIDAVVQVAVLQGRTVAESVTTDDLGLQLELGLAADALVLARLLGAEIGRGDYLSLLNAGVTDPDQLRRLDANALSDIVGEVNTSRIQRMLYEDVS